LGVGIVDIVFDLNYCYRELLITEERERIKHFEITPPRLAKADGLNYMPTLSAGNSALIFSMFASVQMVCRLMAYCECSKLWSDVNAHIFTFIAIFFFKY